MLRILQRTRETDLGFRDHSSQRVYILEAGRQAIINGIITKLTLTYCTKYNEYVCHLLRSNHCCRLKEEVG